MPVRSTDGAVSEFSGEETEASSAFTTMPKPLASNASEMPLMICRDTVTTSRPRPASCQWW